MPVDSQASIEITAFAWVPDFAQGQVRDLRVRWALEEAGLAYRERLLDALPSSRSTQSLIKNGSQLSGRKRMLSAWALSTARIDCAIFAASGEMSGSATVPFRLS